MRASSELNALPDLLRQSAQQNGDKPFVNWQDRTLTFAEFDARTDDLAAGLAARGVKPGQVVSVLLPNSLAFLEAWWAILKTGAVFGPVNPALTAPEVAYVVGHSEAVAIVTDVDGAEKIEAGRDELPALKLVVGLGDEGDVALGNLADTGAPVPTHARGGDDLCAVLYTSGTTGKPKGAMLTHANILANAAMGAELVPLGPGERVGMMLPLFHANAQIVTCVIPLMIGCEVMMWERFSASEFWSKVDEFKPVTISAVPTILAAVLNTPDAPSGPTSLRYMICGAAPLSRELLDAFQDRFGIRILEGYGLTETTCISSINPFYGERKPGSIGMAVRGQAMRIVGDDGGAVEPGGYGEITIQGPNVMPGYLNNPEATAESIRDGWLHTGDVGYVDEDGYFFIVDRSKDMIIRGGENIYPREIEETLYEHPAILECAVIGIPDEVRGEEVLAIVAPKPGQEIDVEELAAWTRERLAKFKVPRRYEVRDELPKTPTGKISKPPLREEFGRWEPAQSG